MWYEDFFTIFEYTFLDIFRIITKYPVIFLSFVLSLVLGIVLFVIRWFYRANS